MEFTPDSSNKGVTLEFVVSVCSIQRKHRANFHLSFSHIDTTDTEKCEVDICHSNMVIVAYQNDMENNSTNWHIGYTGSFLHLW